MSFSEFTRAAVRLSRNPLGIIALFIVLIYAMATVVLVQAKLEMAERQPLIWFLVLFPAVVLGTFAWLVVNHPGKLYGPGDYQNEDNFVSMLSPAARRQKLEAEAAEENAIAAAAPTDGDSSSAPVGAAASTPRQLPSRGLVGRYFLAEELVMRKLETEWKVPIRRGTRVGDFLFDGLAVLDDEAVFIEVKSPSSESSARDAAVRAAQRASHVLGARVEGRRSRLLVALALDYSKDPEALTVQINAALRERGFPSMVQCRVFCVGGLANEFGLPFKDPIVLAS